MFLNNFCSKEIEHANFFNLRIENFKCNVEKEENKYNEQNLKAMKLEIEKLDKSLDTDLIDLIKESNQKLENFLNNITRQVEFEQNDDTALLEEELNVLKQTAMLNISHLQNAQQAALDYKQKG